jgi:hypothetical protein
VASAKETATINKKDSEWSESMQIEDRMGGFDASNEKCLTRRDTTRSGRRPMKLKIK